MAEEMYSSGLSKETETVGSVSLSLSLREGGRGEIDLSIQRDTYFKELSPMVVGAAKSEICRV